MLESKFLISANFKKILISFIPFLILTALLIKSLELTGEYFQKTSVFIYVNIFLLLSISTSLSGVIKLVFSRTNKIKSWFICLTSLILINYLYYIFDENYPSIEEVSSFFILSWVIVSGALVFYLLHPVFKLIFFLLKKIKWKFVQRFITYIENLVSPLYLFPVKLTVYSIFYISKFIIQTIGELIIFIKFASKFPFASFHNFLKSLFYLGLSLYVIATVFVTFDYIRTHYGYYSKFLCSYGTKNKLKKSVVRIVGGYSEGTGFFIDNNQVLTNFHVIADEPSPKIIFPNGKFITPIKMTGNKNADLAILFTSDEYPDMVMALPDQINIRDEEPVIATGFAMGTDLKGDATVVRGNFVSFRSLNSFIQTNISLVEGMSGGPLTDQCGRVVGINTNSLAGLSLFISADHAKQLIPDFTDQNVEKISVDPTKSPEAAVTAFYTYLKARRMKEGFDLLSQEYLQKTNFDEWTNRFTDVLDVYVFKSEKVEKSKDTAFVKFGTKNWVDQEVETHFYEGTWKTVFEDGKYKMLKSNIKEIFDPDSFWFYE